MGQRTLSERAKKGSALEPAVTAGLVALDVQPGRACARSLG